MLFGDTSPIILGKGGVKSALASHNPIPSLNSKGWYDGADTATIIQAMNAVSQWNDKSGNGNHLTQSVGLYQPLTGVRENNGKNALLFNGNSALKIPSSLYGITQGNNTIMAVFKSDTGGTEGVVMGSNGHNGLFRWGLRIISSDYEANSADSYNPVLLGLSGDTLSHIGMMSRNGSDLAISIDGANISSSSNGASTTLQNAHIGANSNASGLFLNGLICEILIFDYQLSSATINQVGRYLGQKWGITWTDI